MFLVLVSQINWLAPGARLPLQELGKQGIRKMCCNAPFVGDPLKCEGALRVSGRTWNRALGLQGGQVGLEKPAKPTKKFLV